MADTIIYVEPLYLQSAALAFPELKKVTLADAGNVVMADNMQEGLATLWGVSPGMDPVSNGETQADGGLPQGLKELDRIQVDGDLPQGLEGLDRIDEAVTGLGEALDDLKEALERLRETIGGASQ